MKLTAKQAAFVDEYLIDLNATQAAIRAGYSEKTAMEQGYQLLQNPSVKESIDIGKKERSEKTGVTAAWLLDRLAQEAKADLADIYNEDGTIKPMKEWPLIWRQGLVAGVETLKVDGDLPAVISKIKISDRIKRLELIGKHVDVSAFLDKVVEKSALTTEEMSDLEAARRMAFLLTSALNEQAVH